ncbi:MAG TPA: DUF5131 family protein [bacterium]|nr:DUF5131 family protein [bacterium]
MTKIEWCDFTWNPVWGCLRRCPYCYARSIAKRFGREVAFHVKSGWNTALGGKLEAFMPTLIKDNLNRPFPTKPSRIFVNSMSDIAYWKDEWLRSVLRRAYKHPEHSFLFLTKEAHIYKTQPSWGQNLWLGVTATTAEEIRAASYQLSATMKNLFLSVEPIHGNVRPEISRMFDWVIVGAETGNRKEKVVPAPEWIEMLADRCAGLGIPLFMKNSLRRLCEANGIPFVQQFPEDLKMEKV